MFCIITQKDSTIFILKYCPCMMDLCQIFIHCQSFNVCIFTTLEDPTIQEVAFEHICFSSTIIVAYLWEGDLMSEVNMCVEVLSSKLYMSFYLKSLNWKICTRWMCALGTANNGPLTSYVQFHQNNLVYQSNEHA